MGTIYDHGLGVPKDKAEAVRWYFKGANQGDSNARSNLRYIYEHGQGIPLDELRKAADQGDLAAKSNLGYTYANGLRVTKDEVEAVKWYRKAADQGEVTAQFILGVVYANGQGVLKDEIEALAWFNVSAMKGNGLAIMSRSILEQRLGQQMALVAQQRSKEILSEIEANQSRGETGGAVETPKQAQGVDSIKASGSGAIVSISGYVLTAAHVVANGSKISVITTQGRKTAKVVRLDEANDLAVLKLETGTYPALPVSGSRRVRLGQAVATIGFPNIGIQGFSPKLTRGEISSLNGIGDDPRSWQISVPVQPGNSGGPLLDENGNLIGVVVAKLGLKAATETGDLPQNVGCAVKGTYSLALLEPYLDGNAPELRLSTKPPKFEDMVAKAEQSSVLILVY